jgi:hypothetical protein
MTILQLLAAAAGIPATELVAFLESVKARLPDLGPAVDKFLADLNLGVSPEAIEAVVAALPKELLDILRGAINPKEHPSDGI